MSVTDELSVSKIIMYYNVVVLYTRSVII